MPRLLHEFSSFCKAKRKLLLNRRLTFSSSDNTFTTAETVKSSFSSETTTYVILHFTYLNEKLYQIFKTHKTDSKHFPSNTLLSALRFKSCWMHQNLGWWALKKFNSLWDWPTFWCWSWRMDLSPMILSLASTKRNNNDIILPFWWRFPLKLWSLCHEKELRAIF